MTTPSSGPPSASNPSNPSNPSNSSDPPITVDVHLGPDDITEALRHDVRHGLGSDPKELPPKWFYDDHGCDLFDQITRLPESASLGDAFARSAQQWG